MLRIIVIVYSLFFFLPIFTYKPNDGAPYLATKILHEYNINTTISILAKKMMLNDFTNRIQDQYGPNAILYLIVSSLQSTPIIDNVQLLNVRTSETRTITFNFINSMGVVFETSAMFNHHPFYVKQSGAQLFFLFFSFLLFFFFFSSLLFSSLLFSSLSIFLLSPNFSLLLSYIPSSFF